MTCPADAANDTSCTCNLLTPESRFGHVADDVVDPVYVSIQQVIHEEHLPFNGAVRQLLKEGVAQWPVPSRQAHRPERWREACLAELRGYLAQR